MDMIKLLDDAEKAIGILMLEVNRLNNELKLRELTDEEIINIIERLTAHWTDSFKNYEYNSDVPEQNKIRDDVFAILKKASNK